MSYTRNRLVIFLIASVFSGFSMEQCYQECCLAALVNYARVVKKLKNPSDRPTFSFLFLLDLFHNPRLSYLGENLFKAKSTILFCCLFIISSRVKIHHCKLCPRHLTLQRKVKPFRRILVYDRMIYLEIPGVFKLR